MLISVTFCSPEVLNNQLNLVMSSPVLLARCAHQPLQYSGGNLREANKTLKYERVAMN